MLTAIARASGRRIDLTRQLCSANPQEELHQVIGWINSARRQKKLTFLNLSDGSSPKTLQVVSPSVLVPEHLQNGSSVRVIGSMQELTEREPSESQITEYELRAHDLQALASTTLEKSTTTAQQIHWPGGSQNLPDLGLMRSPSGLQWRHQLRQVQAMLRLRQDVKRCIESVMSEAGYLEVDTPLITTTDCEGTGEQFSVVTVEASPDPIYLTGSAQLHLELLAHGIARVWTMNHTFRAEKSHSRMHLMEFRMLEVESMYLGDLDALCQEIEALLKNIIAQFLANCEQNKELELDISLVQRSFSDVATAAVDRVQSLKTLLGTPFERVTFGEALHLLRLPANSSSLSRAEELALVQHFQQRPVFVTHFPGKPFYCARDAGTGTALAVDLLVPQVGELVGGSVRNQSLDQIWQSCNESGVQPPQWYCNLRDLPTTGPHGGFGLGFDRLLQFMFAVANIRDVVPFPREMNKTFL